MAHEQTQMVSGKNINSWIRTNWNAFAETMQVIHSLQQLIVGFFSGSNHHNRKHHLLANCKHKDRSNIPAYFYRMEFQKRGTPHIHALFWITQIRSINNKTLSANVPLDDPQLAHHVAYTQSSRSDKHSTPIHKSHTQVTDDDKILFSHSSFSNSLRIQPYVKSINLAYSSHINIQTTDGYRLLLQYIYLPM